MHLDGLEERYVLLWEAVGDITDQIKDLANRYANEAGELVEVDLVNAVNTNAQSLGLLRALEIIKNNLQIRGLLPQLKNFYSRLKGEENGTAKIM